MSFDPALFLHSGTTLTWLSCISNSRQLDAALNGGQTIDLYLRPPIQEYTLLEYNKIEQISSKG